MFLRYYPYLKRKARNKRAKGDKILIFKDYPFFLLGLLSDNIAEYAALSVLKIILSTLYLLHDILRNHRQCNNLRMRMLQRSTCSSPQIFKNKDVLKPFIFLQILCPEAIHRKKILNF